jgi:hypothetical protein
MVIRYGSCCARFVHNGNLQGQRVQFPPDLFKSVLNAGNPRRDKSEETDRRGFLGANW